MKVKIFVATILTVTIFAGGCTSSVTNGNKNLEEIQKSTTSFVSNVSYSGIVDFRYAAKVATPGVVHITSTYKAEKRKPQNGREDDFHGIPDPFKNFFKNDPFFRHFEFRFPDSPEYDVPPAQSSGSGVILSSDGYIVTNNHVIIDANDIEITLSDRRSFKAKIIGTDPQTDLALLKIDAENLSFISYGNSDSLEVGSWVVAVGNPFNLASTVTAGIVSAKARNIHILKDQGAIESFIQTDAAVNPGNSGGALVTLDGKLVGINTAIATPTGVYAGYAFAIPSDIVKKVINDLLNFGTVQRGFMGIIIRDLNSDLAKELKFKNANGVYIDSLIAGGAAKEAGIKKKDVIISIDGIRTDNASKLQELVARKNPGEKIKVLLIREGKEKEVEVVLKNVMGNTDIVKKESSELLKDLGVELQELSKEDKKRYNVNNGVKITKLYTGKLSRYTEVKVGFVITAVNDKPVHSIQSFINEVEAKKGGIIIEGKYANDPTIWYYAFGM